MNQSKNLSGLGLSNDTRHTRRNNQSKILSHLHMKKIVLLTILFAAVQWSVKAQQDPQYTQYMYNMNVINPAYTTNDLGMINLGTLYRSQWVSAVGGPSTLTFFGHVPINEKIETGISLISDKIGDGALKETNLYVDFAYILKLGDISNLSLGLKAGFTNFDTDFTDFQLPEIQDDPAFNDNLSKNLPNVGIGAFYNRQNFYAGLSIPNLLSNKHIETTNGVTSLGSEEMHLFFHRLCL